MTHWDATAPHAGHDLVSPWIALAVYVLGFVIEARVAFATSDGEDRGEDRLAAFGFGLFWPLVLALWIVAGLVMLPTLGVKTKRDRQLRAREAEQERRKMADRIAELEREAGIRP